MKEENIGFYLTMMAIVLLLVILLVALYAPAQQPVPRVKGYPTNADVFLGWMKYSAHVQIRFLNGGHTTYGREQMKDITRELEAGLKCVKQEWKPKYLKDKK